MARQMRSALAQSRMREATEGKLRMDAVFYLQDALQRYPVFNTPPNISLINIKLNQSTSPSVTTRGFFGG
jgi:hypothetical protein